MRRPRLEFRVTADEYEQAALMAKHLSTTPGLAAKHLFMLGANSLKQEQVPARALVAALHADIEEFRGLLEGLHSNTEGIRGDVHNNLQETDRLLRALLKCVFQCFTISRAILKRDDPALLAKAEADARELFQQIVPTATAAAPSKVAGGKV